MVIINTKIHNLDVLVYADCLCAKCFMNGLDLNSLHLCGDFNQFDIMIYNTDGSLEDIIQTIKDFKFHNGNACFSLITPAINGLETILPMIDELEIIINKNDDWNVIRSFENNAYIYDILNTDLTLIKNNVNDYSTLYEWKVKNNAE